MPSDWTRVNVETANSLVKRGDYEAQCRREGDVLDEDWHPYTGPESAPFTGKLDLRVRLRDASPANPGVTVVKVVAEAPLVGDADGWAYGPLSTLLKRFDVERPSPYEWQRCRANTFVPDWHRVTTAVLDTLEAHDPMFKYRVRAVPCVPAIPTQESAAFVATADGWEYGDAAFARSVVMVTHRLVRYEVQYRNADVGASTDWHPIDDYPSFFAVRDDHHLSHLSFRIRPMCSAAADAATPLDAMREFVGNLPPVAPVPVKARWTLMPWNALRCVANIMTKAAAKHGDRTYAEPSPGRDAIDFDAAMRHIARVQAGESPIDAELGEHHYACAAARLMLIVERAHNERFSAQVEEHLRAVVERSCK
jgi:Domain of unknown function (DUF5664)